MLCGDKEEINSQVHEERREQPKPSEQSRKPILAQGRKKKKSENLSRVKVVIPNGGAMTNGTFASPTGSIVSPSSVAPSPETPTDVRYRGVSRTVRGGLLLSNDHSSNLHLHFGGFTACKMSLPIPQFPNHHTRHRTHINDSLITHPCEQESGRHAYVSIRIRSTWAAATCPPKRLRGCGTVCTGTASPVTLLLWPLSLPSRCRSF